MFNKSYVYAASLALAAAMANPSDASVLMAFAESGGDVTLTVSGTFDTTGGNPNTLSGPFSAATAAVNADRIAGIRTGDSYNFFQFGTTGPASIGPGTVTTFGSVGTGDVFFYNWGSRNVGLALDYVSGAAISSSAIFAGTTLGGLGLTTGSYVWDFDNGEQITIEVGDTTPAIPLPAGGLLLLTALAALGVKRRSVKA